MKQIKNFIFFALASLALFSCAKDEAQSSLGASEGTQKAKAVIEVSASYDFSSSRVALEDEGTDGVKVYWKTGDVITLYNGDERLGDFEYSGTDGAASGTFTSVDEALELTEGSYTAVFPASDATSLATRNAEVLDWSSMGYSDNHSLNWAREELRMKSEPVGYDPASQTTIRFTMKQEFALLSLTIKLEPGHSLNEMELRDGENARHSYHFSFGENARDHLYVVNLLLPATGADEASSRVVHYRIRQGVETRYDHSTVVNTKFEAGKRYTVNIEEFNNQIPVFNRADLESIKDYNTGSYFLAQDLDLGSTEWTPIPSFSGNLDGNNKTISNLMISNGTQNVGLFATASGVEIKNLKLSAVDLTGQQNVGALVGNLDESSNESSKLINCAVISGEIKSNDGSSGDTADYSSFGALVGAIGNLSSSASPRYIIACSNSASVSGKGALVGGIAGSAENTHFIACKNHGTLALARASVDSEYIGGIVGLLKSGGAVVGCYNSAEINNQGEGANSTSAYICNLEGEASSYSIKGCYNIGSIQSVSSGVVIDGVTDLEDLAVDALNAEITSMNAAIKEKVSGVEYRESPNTTGTIEERSPLILAPNLVEIL